MKTICRQLSDEISTTFEGTSREAQFFDNDKFYLEGLEWWPNFLKNDEAFVRLEEALPEQVAIIKQDGLWQVWDLEDYDLWSDAPQYSEDIQILSGHEDRREAVVRGAHQVLC